MHHDDWMTAVIALAALNTVTLTLLVIVRTALQQALLDPLTGLPQRQLWTITAAARYRGMRHPAVLMIDVNHLKRVNDQLGHAYGDLLIRIIAHEILHIAGPNALVGRLGGDEFAALIDLAPEHRADLAAAAQGCIVSVDGIISSAEFGAAQLTDLETHPERHHEAGDDHHRRELSRLMRAADLALLRAKAVRRASPAPTSPALAFYRRSSDGEVPHNFNTLPHSALLRIVAPLLRIRPARPNRRTPATTRP
ncbi:GGDEF domain-containing protein [Lentzea jiangxiensis]|uniref:Diguanylate cyclase (GGDEF) domain-containing protein n=1 Tax=Lentzea jiangxiensis TaxID=641025 RepID=A0A1H0X4B7_9PSEU|nr:GGDEF domain-containing protein [Lentzea jiangxiensis]SDP97794.1 diguanylate cyclase (GGDEF) domain-containing protein [Lentzea jiangxiensis]